MALCELGKQQDQHGEEDEFERSVGVGQQQHDRRHEGEGQHFGGRQIKLIRMPPQERSDALAQWRLKAHSAVK